MRWQSLLLIAFLWTLYVGMRKYSCIKTCGREFTDQHSLNLHQNRCVTAKNAENVSRQTQIEARKSRKRRKLEKAEDAAKLMSQALPDGSSSSAVVPDVEMGSVSDSAMDLDPDPDAAAATTDAAAAAAARHPSPSPPLTESGRHTRKTRIPARFADNLPAGPVPIPNPVLPPAESGAGRVLPRVILIVRDTIRTGMNKFGLFREYPHRPSYDPDAAVMTNELLRPSHTAAADPSPISTDSHSPPWPFANMSIYRLMQWFNSGSSLKSAGEVTRLAAEVITANDFDPLELKGFDAQRENARFDRAQALEADDLPGDGWVKDDLVIEVPTGARGDVAGTEHFVIPDFFHRDIVEMIKSTFSGAAARQFHLTPFKRLWKPSASGPEERVHDELYASDAWIDAHEKLQRQQREPGCDLERVIAGLMFWSDATHLTSFGTAKAWPIYLFFGNQSKYDRAKPSSGACHHLAYVPSIPDKIQSVFARLAGGLFSRKRKDSLLTHCRRELMQAAWSKLLTPEFLKAYYHGIVIRCADGIIRRVFPRIFTYSADYPEKVLLATIKNLGQCPCPRCLVLKVDIDKMGLTSDMRTRTAKLRGYFAEKVALAREFVYNRGIAVTGAAVERILKPFSLVPTTNVFAEKLAGAFDIHCALVVDLMHEFELGVFKDVFKHLIRLLYAAVPGGNAVIELNERFRQVPSFGRDTIRRFSNNVSEMKKLAARDFEDLLQCSIPVFEGLLPSPYDGAVRKLLYRLAEWHALAKLRMHTDSTLDLLESATTELGREMRSFRKGTCAQFQTMELPGEQAARARRKSRKKQDSTDLSAHSNRSAAAARKPSSNKTEGKQFNLITYKFHALADYVKTIRLFGTTDSYTSQIGELAHRWIKRLYSRTNKKNAIEQITRHERRETKFRQRREKELADTELRSKTKHSHHGGNESPDQDPLVDDAEVHHYISDSRNSPHEVTSFTRNFPDDPATKDFIPKLKNHLLGRLLNCEFDGDEMSDFTDAERNTVRIVNNRVYAVNTLRVNYTTYDVRREQDCMNPRTHSDVMVRSPETGPGASQFWYARVLGVFHANVYHSGPSAKNRSVQRMEFLWVRWFGSAIGYHSGSKRARLPKVGFVPDTDESAFGFLDPSLVIRGCHLIPAFVDGRTPALLNCTHSAGRAADEIDDWEAYYVNIFVDRDMFMRFLGGGVGHDISVQRRYDADEDTELRGGEDDPQDSDSNADYPMDDDENEDDSEELDADRSEDSGSEDREDRSVDDSEEGSGSDSDSSGTGFSSDLDNDTDGAEEFFTDDDEYGAL
ncbi:hypothetical protein PLICRDRAFT_46731 [Plicaturopsis crispa FD-325 SS-3]|uniref:C2H2-type domain-containing protein n=1 Tax=Plicaturopsis crispa FD-325 SS-3 TaxID=944288 RepID=A0A0C9SQP0_PLICR|nr:hypothetical protein PLICRDRAFT_46731 [Plicaturopsis crispa FD-325 SS-3]